MRSNENLSEADEEDLDTRLPFSNVGIPLLHCLLVQQAEKLTSNSVDVRDTEVVTKQYLFSDRNCLIC